MTKTLTLHATHVPHNIKEAFEQRAQRYMFRTFDPFQVAKVYENRTIPECKAEWDMMVQVTKARMSGHYTADEIRKAEFELR